MFVGYDSHLQVKSLIEKLHLLERCFRMLAFSGSERSDEAGPGQADSQGCEKSRRAFQLVKTFVGEVKKRPIV
jgi:hypothetical protein